MKNIQEEQDALGTVYEVGDFDGNPTIWKVAIAECGPGNMPAQRMVFQGIQYFHPDIVVFAGVAGSLKDDISLGQVVASSKVIFYPPGKDEESFKPRFEIANSHYSLVQRARATARGDKWQARIQGVALPIGEGPTATIAPIATGELVVASDRSHTYSILRQYCSDAVAVEMEGYGTVASAEHYSIPSIVIRAISDRVMDKEERDAEGWQPIAAANAAAFLFEMLANHRVQSPTFPVVIEAEVDLEPTDAKPSELPNPQRKDTVDSIKLSASCISKTLLNWETTLPSGTWIERPELQTLVSTIATTETSTTVVLGLPGAGKSSLLAELGRRLSASKIPILALKADLIHHQVASSADLASFLDLPETAEACIRSLSASGPVVLIIDQLDALGNLLDLHSQRLNVLLNLINNVSATENVHIVCSCRSFEYQHDVRLSRLEATKIQLELPPWEHVAGLLKSHYDIDGSNWPETFREVLRVPQHLKVFLSQLRGSNEYQITTSYQQLLDDLWESRVVNPSGPSGRGELLMTMAGQMAREEVLWVPLAQYEDRQSQIESLESAGLLQRSPSKIAIGFRHQTLFEHALARSFSIGEISLTEHVLARQDALFVRPILWHTLVYLREVHRALYETELHELCVSAARLHIVYLLIEFIGQLTEPSDNEHILLQRWIEDAQFRGRAIISVANSEGWFRRLQDTHIPALMELPEAESWPTVILLRGAWRFAPEKCLQLLREYWLSNPERDVLSFNVLRELTLWDEEAIAAVCTIVDRTKLNDHFVMFLVEEVSGVSPELAPRIVGTILRRDLRGTEEASENEEDSESDSGADFSWLDKSAFEELLERNSGYYGLPAVAEAAPGAFLEEVWPWFIEVLNHILRPDHHIIRSFREYYGLVLDLDWGTDPSVNNGLMLSIHTAILTYGETQPDDFSGFVNRWKDFDAKPVQRLLCRGLTAAAPHLPEVALQFLIEDPRRLALGGHHDDHSDTRALMRGLVDHLNAGQLQRLVQAIKDWSGYLDSIEGETAEDRFMRRKWDREKRLRLLKTLPFERLDPETQSLIRHEEVALPDYSDYDHKIPKVTVVGSVMSADEMGRAKDEQVINLFDELVDSTGADHPRQFGRGGSEQASYELARLAEKNPTRVAQLLLRLDPKKQQNPASYAISALGKNKDFPTRELFKLILSLDQAGFQGNDFRGEAGDALFHRANDEDGLPDYILEMLESWLDQWGEFDKFYDDNDPDGRREDSHLHSVLWDHTSYTVPRGSYRVLTALTYGYLRRKPSQVDNWLYSLERHLDRSESNYTWKVLCEELRYLRDCDEARASTFILRLFDKYPRVRDSRFGVLFVARNRFYLKSDVYRGILHAIRDSDWKLGKQAYGELLGISYLSDEFVEWIDAEVEYALHDPSIVTGLAHAVGHSMWENGQLRKKGTLLFERIAPIADDESVEALMRTFVKDEPLPAHNDSRRLLQAVSENTVLLLGAPDHWFAEKLEDVVTYCPDLVCTLCNQLIDVAGKEIGDIQTARSLSASNLVDISMTLQRLYDFRVEGLNLFERLLDLGVYDASSVLVSLDRRALSPAPPRPPRRRRRRQAGASGPASEASSA